MKTLLFIMGLLLALPVVTTAPAWSVEPDEVLADPALEARARELSKVLRCLVCQNQSIDDSNAGLARDLRILVRQRLTAGDSNDEVFAYLKARYGDFVLLEPPVRPGTYLLWFGPLIMVLLGGAGVGFYFFRRHKSVTAGMTALSSAEQARLKHLLDSDNQLGPDRT